MQAFILFIMMIFVYPVIFFSSLHLLKANYELKYTLFQIWSRFFIKRASAKVECLRADLIPLENDYVFVSVHENALDACLLAEALPVRTHFILDKNERIPYLNTYLKRLKSSRIDYSSSTCTDHTEQFENDLNESSITVFTKNLKGHPLPIEFYDCAKSNKWTLIPILIHNSKNLMKKGRHHQVKVEVKVPIYFEEYGQSSAADIEKLILERLEEQ